MTNFQQLAAEVYAEHGDDQAAVGHLYARTNSPALRREAIELACYEALNAERRGLRGRIISDQGGAAEAVVGATSVGAAAAADIDAVTRRYSAFDWPLKCGKALRRATMAEILESAKFHGVLETGNRKAKEFEQTVYDLMAARSANPETDLAADVLTEDEVDSIRTSVYG